MFVIAAIILERNLQNVANYLVASLAVADLLVACLVMPLSAVYEVSSSACAIFSHFHVIRFSFYDCVNGDFLFENCISVEFFAFEGYCTSVAYRTCADYLISRTISISNRS